MDKLVIKRRFARLEDYYNFMHDKRGIALIFNHETFINPVHTKRNGTIKDGEDLKAALEKLNFEVELYMDYKLHEIRNKLLEVSKKDHSRNDCLWVTVLSHGGKDGKIYSSDKHYQVEELWENFLGEKCKTLIGKPKMFIIQACRGEKIDFGNVLELDPSDGVKEDSKKVTVRQFADLLVMYSTVDGHYSYRNIIQGSWFIQALCKELKVHPHDDLMHILARVNRKVASEVKLENNSKFKNAKQIPYIESTLRKSIIFFKKSSDEVVTDIDSVSSVVKPKNIPTVKMNEHLRYDMSNDNRSIALIFNQEYESENNSGVKQNIDELKDDLKKLDFDVKYRVVSTIDEIKEILKEVSKADHSNTDCLLVTLMTSCSKNGQIVSAELDFHVKELWENFVGEICESLVGKPKLFFIEETRGTENDGFKIGDQKISKSANSLVMSSTTEGYSSFHSETDGSRLIKALCEELNTYSKDDSLSILTAVNRRVDFKIQFGAANQMPSIVSMLTKIMQFTKYKNNGTDLSVKSKKIVSNGCDNHSLKMPNASYYDMSHAKRGVAIIFIQERCNGELRNAQKDGDDLKTVLEGLEFDVRSYIDLSLDEIRKVLFFVSKEDHSNNDCFLLSILSLGTEDGKIYSSDWNFSVYELWENFVGDNCKSLIGKPKLFFIQACRGSMDDPGVLLKRPQRTGYCDYADSNLSKPTFEISNISDLFVMYSTADDHDAYRNPRNGSWFIQALCEELKIDLDEDIVHILMRVNKKECYGWDTQKNMPFIVSMLTKKIIFTHKDKQRKTKKMDFNCNNSMMNCSGRDRQSLF